MMTIES